MTSLAVAEVESSAKISEVASSANIAEVASLADLAGDVTVGVASSAVAGVASSADIAGDISISVMSLADPASVVTTGVAFQEKCDVPSGSVCDYDDYFYDGHYDENPNYFDYDYPGDFDTCSYFDVYGFIEPV